MCSKLGFSKRHDISLQDLSHSSSAQQPSKTGKNGTVRTTQRTHGVSTYKLHCTAKTAKFFLARKLMAKQVQKHAEHAESNTDHVAATADHASAKTTCFLPSHRTCTYTQGHKTGGPTGTKFSHPLMTAVCPRVLDLFHLKDSVSLHSRGTGQTPVDKIHSSSPQYENVHGLLGRQSISLTRQQTRRN